MICCYFVLTTKYIFTVYLRNRFKWHFLLISSAPFKLNFIDSALSFHVMQDFCCFKSNLSMFRFCFLQLSYFYDSKMIWVFCYLHSKCFLKFHLNGNTWRSLSQIHQTEPNGFIWVNWLKTVVCIRISHSLYEQNKNTKSNFNQFFVMTMASDIHCKGG